MGEADGGRAGSSASTRCQAGWRASASVRSAPGSLVAAKGDIYRHRFRHYADGSTCTGGRGEALHMLAKDIVMRATSIQLPDGEVRSITLGSELELTLGEVQASMC